MTGTFGPRQIQLKECRPWKRNRRTKGYMLPTQWDSKPKPPCYSGPLSSKMAQCPKTITLEVRLASPQIKKFYTQPTEGLPFDFQLLPFPLASTFIINYNTPLTPSCKSFYLGRLGKMRHMERLDSVSVESAFNLRF